MGKSYRRPYAAITGVSSAKDDKQRAARGMRRKQNQWLKTISDFEDALIPHRRECSWNQVWCWKRDGKKHLSLWPPDWFQKITRK